MELDWSLYFAMKGPSLVVPVECFCLNESPFRLNLEDDRKHCILATGKGAGAGLSLARPMWMPSQVGLHSFSGAPCCDTYPVGTVRA